MNIPFIDFSEQYNLIKDEVDAGLKSVFQKGNFILGEEEKDFEAQFAHYCDAKYAVGVNSGTDALYLALAALDIKPGDEVIVPSFTFIATALCISYTGAKPVFVDVEDQTYNMDSDQLKKAITDKTKVIMPVHIYGQPANMDEINKIAQERNIAVVEDACQAHGSTYKGKKVGSLGDIACFSFYPTKSLGGFGDGGMIVSDNINIDEKTKMLRDYGRQGRYDHKIKGFNSRLDTVQAVVLAAKLKHLDQWNKMRNDNAAYYCELLKDVDGVVTPLIKDDRTHVFQTFAVRLQNRDKICDELKKKGVGVLIHYPIPVHLQEAYADLGYKKGDLPVSEQLADEVLSLPMFPHMNKNQIEYVCESLKELVAARV
ncbi:MAG: DegT/DnrJ/EryC1/StrS family aminotransferase [Candidatus Omnitrophica bacterium]|nr:DegT/DnrJ/EryC1/StrS family aminotransferase [Candidatus Omnitrophota bacterium]MCB9747395.1 DegT/DnrJ/EryC1/StrS family aminotransferase [Candidatus Omnitrophota bacterium]